MSGLLLFLIIVQHAHGASHLVRRVRRASIGSSGEPLWDGDATEIKGVTEPPARAIVDNKGNVHMHAFAPTALTEQERYIMQDSLIEEGFDVHRAFSNSSSTETDQSNSVFIEAQKRREYDGGETVEKQYKHYKVIAVRPDSKKQVDMIENLVETDTKVDLWTEDLGVNLDAELMVPPGHVDNVIDYLKAAGMKPSISVSDVGKLVKAEHIDNTKAFNANQVGNIIGRYATIDEINAWMDSFARQHASVTVVSLGNTFENRPIKMLRLAKSAGLPIMYVEAGLHAREWAAVAATIWSINHLITSSGAIEQKLARSFEWQFVPVANPDGYHYSTTGMRMWRKNRRSGQGRCAGVDLNRNWDHLWGTTGISRDPCSDVYPGTGAFSEPETQVLKNHMLNYKSTQGDHTSRMKMYISHHTYTQLWLFPPGAGQKPSDYQDLLKVGTEAARRVSNKHNKYYKAGSPQDILYSASGGSFDWVHNVVGVKYTYVPELRPSRSDRWGFMLPTSQLIPCAEETWEGVKYIAEIAGGGPPPPTPKPTPKPTPPPRKRTRCFSRDTSFAYAAAHGNGDWRIVKMEGLRAGDFVLAVNMKTGIPFADRIVTNLHVHDHSEHAMLEIRHTHGIATMTPDHVLLVDGKYIPARYVRPGNTMLASFLQQEDFTKSVLTNVTVLSIKSASGRIINPLTHSGLILLASDVGDHDSIGLVTTTILESSFNSMLAMNQWPGMGKLASRLFPNEFQESAFVHDIMLVLGFASSKMPYWLGLGVFVVADAVVGASFILWYSGAVIAIGVYIAFKTGRFVKLGESGPSVAREAPALVPPCWTHRWLFVRPA